MITATVQKELLCTVADSPLAYQSYQSYAPSGRCGYAAHARATRREGEGAARKVKETLPAVRSARVTVSN